MNRTFSILKNIMLLITFVCVIGLVLSSTAQYFDPLEHWWIALVGLTFLPLMAITFFFFVFWVIVRIRLALLPLIGLLASVPAIKHVVAIDVFSARTKSTAHDFRVMTYNVRNFDLYKWTKEQETRRKMLSMIGDEQPDIACFQEFYYRDTGLYDNKTLLIKTLGLKYNHILSTYKWPPLQHWGIATFSKYPIVDTGRVDFRMKSNNTCIYTDIDVKGQIIRVYNVHLQSVYLNRKDYAYIEDFNADKLNRQSNQQIIGKLKNAYQRRAEQVHILTEHIKNSPYPVLLCGDFNDTPVSFTYKTFLDYLNDSFLEKGWGFAPTYSGFIPLLRIDYLMHTDDIVTNSYRTNRQNYSDHYPVIAEFSFKNDSSIVK